MAQTTLLVVDDELGLVDLLKAGLELEGYRVLTALDGQNALRLARSEKPDLMILDIAMPGMDGWEVMDRIEADPETAGLPVIFLSALTAEGDIIHGLEMGALDYITKPFDFRRLLSAVRTLTEKLDSRGQDQYRRQLIAQRQHLMRSLRALFPNGSEGRAASQPRANSD